MNTVNNKSSEPTTNITNTQANGQITQNLNQNSREQKEQEQKQINDFTAKQNKSYMDLWVETIIRPPRCIYDPSNLGLSRFVVGDQNTIVNRIDFQLSNPRNLQLQCRQSITKIKYLSLFQTNLMKYSDHSVVIYLHGSSSCRLEALELIKYLIPQNIALCTFDFAGSGISEGQYISLGNFEQEDVQIVVEHLKKTGKILNIGLWGRSMGATTAILACRNSKDLNTLVCDSPFSSLKIVCQTLAWSQYHIPCCIFAILFCFLRRKVRQKANFNVDSLNILGEIKKLPDTKNIMFLSAFDDQLIQPFQVISLFEAFKGVKELVRFPGNHNSQRSKETQEKVVKFFIQNLASQDKIKTNLVSEEIEIMIKK